MARHHMEAGAVNVAGEVLTAVVLIYFEGASP